MEVILVNHGSRRREFNQTMESWAAEISRRLGVRAVVGYNEYAEPNWRQLLREGQGPAIIALAFLGAGNHVARDIMGELGVSGFERWEMSSFRRPVYVTRPLGDSPLVLSALISRILKALGKTSVEIAEQPEEIEESSMAYVANALGLDLSKCEDALVARAVYASGNLDLARRIHITGDLCKSAEEAIAAGMWAVADVKMVASGLRYDKVRIAVEEAPEGCKATRAYCGVEKLARELKAAMLVVGNAPTALKAGLDVWRRGEAELAFVIAAAVGFTNAEAVKEEVVSSGLPAFVVRGTMGGSGIAAAVFNELMRRAYGG